MRFNLKGSWNLLTSLETTGFTRARLGCSSSLKSGPQFLTTPRLRAKVRYKIPLRHSSAINLSMAQVLPEAMLPCSEPLTEKGGIEANSSISAACDMTYIIENNTVISKS